MKNIELTKIEERALLELLSHRYAPCSSGCIFPEMQESKKNCDKCDYAKAIDGVANKMGLFE